MPFLSLVKFLGKDIKISLYQDYGLQMGQREKIATNVDEGCGGNSWGIGEWQHTPPPPGVEPMVQTTKLGEGYSV